MLDPPRTTYQALLYSDGICIGYNSVLLAMTLREYNGHPMAYPVVSMFRLSSTFTLTRPPISSEAEQKEGRMWARVRNE